MVKRIALLRGDLVANVIQSTWEFAATLGFDQAIELPLDSPVGPGWRLVGPDEFVPPEPEPVSELAPIDFMRRFQVAEWIAANELAKTDGVMAYAFALFNRAAVVRLAHADTVTFVGYMQQHGILSAERAAAILAS